MHLLTQSNPAPRRGCLSQTDLEKSLAIPDLTENPNHAISQMMTLILEGLPTLGWPTLSLYRGDRVVSRAENYGLLGYDDGEVTLSSVHTKWVDSEHLLRTQTTSLISNALPKVLQTRRIGTMVGLAAPGMTYRRDQRDRWHCSEPHQMDLWVGMDSKVLTTNQGEGPHPLLLKWVGDILSIALPGVRWRSSPSPHHYTEGGIEIEVLHEGTWVEVMECGLIAKTLLERLGLDSTLHGGLALGMGLDRLVMIRKNIPDIRLLRDSEPRVQAQMQNLNPWKRISKQPSTSRDLSLVREGGGCEEALVEEVMLAMGEKQAWCEAIEVKGIWKEEVLPEVAKARLGLEQGQENWLIRITLRDWHRSIPAEDANALYRQVYERVHQGKTMGYLSSNP